MCTGNSNVKDSDVLDRPILMENLDSSFWKDKCDYIEIEQCKNLNPNNYNLVVVQLNIRSLLSKQVELKLLLSDLEKRGSRVDLILLCKTFLSDSTLKLVNIPGYKLYSDHRKNHKGGGMAILVRNDIVCKRRTDLMAFQEKEIESTFIEIQSKSGKTIVVGSMYRPPNSTEGGFITEIMEVICKTNQEKRELILGMDHNLDLLKCAEHIMMQKFLNCLLDNDMLPTITRPTRIPQNTATLIDNIFVSSKLSSNWASY